MLKNNAVFKISGTIGNTTYCKSKKGTRAIKKPHIPPERFHADPAFQAQQQNVEKFILVSRLAAAIIPHIPPTNRGPYIMGKMVKKAYEIMRTNNDPQQIFLELKASFNLAAVNIPYPEKNIRQAHYYRQLSNLQLNKENLKAFSNLFSGHNSNGQYIQQWLQWLSSASAYFIGAGEEQKITQVLNIISNAIKEN